MNRRVAVTGATGFIGWHACVHLRDAGWHVSGLARPGSRKPLPAGVDRVSASLEPADLERACAHASVIVHAAGITQARTADDYQRINVEGARAVAETARTLGARMLHISSLTAAGPAPANEPRTERQAADPITAYGRSKAASEAVVTALPGLQWTTIRPAAVYGPRDRQFFPLFQAARRGWLFRPPNADHFALTLVHIDDVARAVTMACAHDAADRETLFIGHPEPVTLDALLRALALTFERTYRPVPAPLALVRLSARLGIGGLSAERVRELQSPGFVCSVERAACFGFRAAIDLPEGLRQTAAWYIAEGWL